jgi:hydroxymethylbilane synthase
VIRLATRGSALARAQTALAEEALRAAGVDGVEMVVVRTTGDRSPETPLEQLEGVGWFTSELESALWDGRADAAIHSAKDLPADLREGLVIAANLHRGDCRDALVTRDGATLETLRDGATVGTSSPRRAAVFGVLRPELRPVAIRGNVDTRLRKLDEGQVDALILACAGLDRLGLGGRITQRLDPATFVPAPAQGAVTLEVVARSPAEALCARVDHAETTAAVVAERAVLRGMNGGCRLPLGAWARVEGGRLLLRASLVEAGSINHVDVEGDPSEAASLGALAAERLRAGAGASTG